MTSSPEASLEVFAEFIGTVAHLRQECPWDKEQTHSSLRKHLLEEAYETLEAIDDLAAALADAASSSQPADAANSNTGQVNTEQAVASQNLRDELGDLLYQVFFHSLLAQERGEFDVADVVVAINAKLIRRHPHVFGDLEVSSQEELAPHWEAIKQAESNRKSVMDGIPKALPALLYASKLQRKAASQGAKAPEVPVAPAESPVGQALQEAELTESSVGELLFEIVRLATQRGIDCEAALRQSAQEFKSRFQKLESSGDDVAQPAARGYIWQGKLDSG